MAAFDANDPGLEQNRAYHLLAEGPVTLFWRMSLLSETVAWLADHRYQVIRIHSGDWTSEMDMHRTVAQALGFPDYYGHNLDALNDCLRDIAEGRVHHHAPEWMVDSTGLVLAFSGYDAFIVHQPRVAWVVLDIVAAQSRQARRHVDWVESYPDRLGFHEPWDGTYSTRCSPGHGEASARTSDRCGSAPGRRWCCADRV